MNCTDPGLERLAPAAYRISVGGTLSPSWLRQYANMSVNVERDARGRAVSVVTGELIDQAQLMGVLTLLYEMGYSLMSFERIEKS